MLRMSRVALGSALALSMMTGAVLAQSQTQEKLPWATAAEPAETTQVAAVDKKQAVPPLPVRNAMFAAQEAEAKAGPLQRLLQGTSTQGQGESSDVSRAFRQGDGQ